MITIRRSKVQSSSAVSISTDNRQDQSTTLLSEVGYFPPPPPVIKAENKVLKEWFWQNFN